MRTEKKRFILPLCGVVLICLYPIPYFIVQALPGSLTQEGWFVKMPDGFGGMENSLVTYSKAEGIYDILPTSGAVWEVSLFTHKWYFTPIANVLDKMGWGSRYKYL